MTPTALHASKGYLCQVQDKGDAENLISKLALCPTATVISVDRKNRQEMPKTSLFLLLLFNYCPISWAGWFTKQLTKFCILGHIEVK